jgi:hypothetical protein
VMNATFAALLDVAYAEGGGLLKFGGDALLLLYEGDHHAQRAARAAFEMRSTLPPEFVKVRLYEPLDPGAARPGVMRSGQHRRASRPGLDNRSLDVAKRCSPSA